MSEQGQDMPHAKVQVLTHIQAIAPMKHDDDEVPPVFEANLYLLLVV